MGLLRVERERGLTRRVGWGGTQPLLEVFQTLLEEGVLSAPVWDEGTSEYCGFVDLQDLLSYVVYEWDKVVRDAPPKPTHTDCAAYALHAPRHTRSPRVHRRVHASCEP